MTSSPSRLAHVPLDPAAQFARFTPAPPARRAGAVPGQWVSAGVETAPAPRRGRLVSCAGARGGAGATVLASALARTAARVGLNCLLVDGDPLGSGLDLLLGAEDAPGMRWPDLALARGSLAAGTLSQSLPVIDGIRVLTWDRDADGVSLRPEALSTVLAAGLAEHDLVVLDLPRTPVSLPDGDGRASLGLIVVPLEVRAASAAAKVRAQIYAGVGDVRIVVRGPAPTGLTSTAVASVLGLPIAAELRAEPGLAAALDRGEPPGLRVRGPLSRACRSILGQLTQRHGSGAG